MGRLRTLWRLSPATTWLLPVASTLMVLASWAQAEEVRFVPQPNPNYVIAVTVYQIHEIRTPEMAIGRQLNLRELV